jgi:hypothetical protein
VLPACTALAHFFVATGNISNPIPASQYFDGSIYLEATKA